MPPPRKRISSGTEMLMKGTAWFVYATNFLINLIGDLFAIGEVLSFAFMGMAYVGFAFWFGIKGVSIVDPKYAKEFFLKMLLGVIPIVNVLPVSKTKNGLFVPGICGMVENIIERAKTEDNEYNQKIQASRMPKNQQKPNLNSNQQAETQNAPKRRV